MKACKKPAVFDSFIHERDDSGNENSFGTMMMRVTWSKLWSNILMGNYPKPISRQVNNLSKVASQIISLPFSLNCVTTPMAQPGAVGCALRVLDYLIPQYLGYK